MPIKPSEYTFRISPDDIIQNPHPSDPPPEESLGTILLDTIFIMQENLDTLGKTKIALMGEDMVDPIAFDFDGLPVTKLAELLRDMALYQQSEAREILEAMVHD